MTSRRSSGTHRGAGVAKLLLALGLLAGLGRAQADEGVWPRQFESDSGSFVIYQPQPEALTGDLLSARAAFSLQKAEDASPVFGVLWFTERIQIDRDSSVVTGADLDVTRVRLPGITTGDASRYEKFVEAEATRWDLSGSLDELRAGLAASEQERASVEGLDNTPPRIVVTFNRAILLQYDESPVFEPIEGTRLERASNTPLAVIYEPSSRQYYLNGANLWYRASDPMGPWTAPADPPAEVREAVPPDTSAQDQVRGEAPEVVTATDPTELISIDGQPSYGSLAGDQLLYVTNTESDIVRDVDSQQIFLLLAGRWFRSKSLDGPWRYVRGDQLPAAFSKVPPDSPKGNILASVAGTDQAEDAVADAEIPQTSAIRLGASDFQVFYDGDPRFENIPGTNMEYAVNTDAQVILADGRYYACDQGVWFVADDPNGPWSVSQTRPIGLDDVPPSCPVYNTRYVYVYDVGTAVVYDGYLPGYVGSYPYYGTVVYGTGHHYRPWRGKHRYFARPATWGFHARYNPWLSRWSFGYSYGASFLRVSYRWRFGTSVGREHNPPLWFGPGGYRRPLLGADRSPLRVRGPRRLVAATLDRTPGNIYNRTENLPRVDRSANRQPLRRFAIPFSRRPSGTSDVFAGKDGKVYQRDPAGTWRVNDGTGWVPTPAPVTPPATTAPVPGTPSPAPAPAPSTGRGSDGSRTRAFPPNLRQPIAPAPVNPAPRPSQTPPSTPAPRPRVEPVYTPPARPAPPPISSAPGNLEQEYHARRRAEPEARPEVQPPAPAPAPARVTPSRNPPASTVPTQPARDQAEPQPRRDKGKE
jgi:hypothetical protein